MRYLVARLTTGFSGGLFGQPNLAPAMAGLRGVEDGPLMYEAEEIQVMAEVMDDASIQVASLSSVCLPVSIRPTGSGPICGKRPRTAPRYL